MPMRVCRWTKRKTGSRWLEIGGSVLGGIVLV